MSFSSKQQPCNRYNEMSLMMGFTMISTQTHRERLIFALATRRFFDVHSTSRVCYGRQMNVEAKLCAWDMCVLLLRGLKETYGEWYWSFYWPDLWNDVLWGGLQNQIILSVLNASFFLITRTSNLYHWGRDRAVSISNPL